ncbi:MAG: hypothetical protein CEE40_02595 [Chloroflexi bacterium B3_Chlor]|nr:MAG: hypothetical protein CEE40_02595 [Chloroflexi bacterium B3_Chlor]
MAGNRAAFEAAVKKGHSYAWEKRWMKAIEQYELATTEFPDDATARSGLAFAYLKGDRLREALREYRKVCELGPGDPSPRRKIAQILEDLGRVTDAVEAWMTLAELSVQQKDLRQAIEAWQQAIRLQPVNKEAHEKLADAHAYRSNTAEAIKQFLTLARLHYEDGEHQQAVEYCQRVLSLDGRNKAARVLLERVASDGETDFTVESIVMRREELGPVDVAVQQALASLAEALLGEGELVEGTERVGTEGNNLESHSSPVPDVGTVLGKAIDAHSRGRIDQALSYYEQAFQMGVGRVEVLFNLGLLYKERSRFEEAVDVLERSVKVPEYRLPSHLALGECHWAQGEANAALDHFLEALKIIELDIMGLDRADEIARCYRDLADSHGSRGDGRETEVFVHSLTEFLSGSDWKRKAVEARQKLDSLAGDGISLILPELLEVPGGDEVLDIMAKSREYLKNDMPFIALEECYRAIEMAPTYLPLHIRLAEIFAQQGKAEEAVSKYAAVAEAYLMRDSPYKAIEAYGRALQAAPMSTSIREKLIDLLIEHDEIDLAVDEYVALGESCYRLARVDMALERYDQALGLVHRTATPTDWEVRILHRMADLHMQRVRWKRAMAIYEKIRQLSPSDEDARLRLVELHYKLGQQELALRELDALIVHYGTLKEFEKITNTLRELVSTDPQDISLRSRLGRIYIELGMKKEAIAELDTVGELQLEAGRKREAIETLRTIIALGPEEKDAYTQLLGELDKSPDSE